MQLVSKGMELGITLLTIGLEPIALLPELCIRPDLAQSSISYLAHLDLRSILLD